MSAQEIYEETMKARTDAFIARHGPLMNDMCEYYGAESKQKIAQLNELKIVLKHLSYRDFCVKLVAESASDDTCLTFLQNLLEFIHYLSSSVMDLLDKTLITPIMLHIATHAAFRNAHTLIAYIYLAKYSQTDMNSLLHKDFVLNLLIKLAKKCARLIESNASNFREKMLIEDDSDTLHHLSRVENVCHVTHDHVTLSLPAVLDTIFFFNLKSDEFKTREDFEAFCNILARIIRHGTRVECEYALKLVYQFCFDSIFVESLSSLAKLKEIVTKFSSNSKSGGAKQRSILHNYSEGILRLMNAMSGDDTCSTTLTEENEAKETISAQSLRDSVYISHDFGDRFEAYEILKYLKKNTRLRVYLHNYFKSPVFSFEKSLKRINACQCMLISKLVL